MDKKLVGIVSVFIFLVVLSVGFIFSSNKLEEAPTKSLTATVMNVDGANVTVQDENHVIYTFNDINNVIAVQYHPESAAGPEDSEYIFNRFMELMKKCGGNSYAKKNRY